mmetsp:Transcript_31012/g.68671  ORF Transcript_31012/g.68671 Transcript_31012/m.68671 type:complete len:224 (+) Transcript_31012:362-1033(+)
MAVAVNILQEVFNHGKAAGTNNLSVLLQVVKGFITNGEGCGEVRCHNVVALVDVGGSVNTSFILATGTFRDLDLEGVLLLVTPVKVMYFLGKVKTTVGTLKWLRLTTAVHSFPRTGRDLIRSLSGAVEEGKGRLGRLGIADALVDRKVDFVRLRIPAFAAVVGLANDKEGLGLVETGVTFFVDEHGGCFGVILEKLEHFLTAGVNAKISARIMNGRGGTNLDD